MLLLVRTTLSLKPFFVTVLVDDPVRWMLTVVFSLLCISACAALFRGCCRDTSTNSPRRIFTSITATPFLSIYSSGGMTTTVLTLRRYSVFLRSRAYLPPRLQYLPSSSSFQSGKPQFSYIYGVALLGTTAIYLLLNLMSDRGIDAYRTASVLGYCLLPMVGLGGVGMGVGIE